MDFSKVYLYVLEISQANVKDCCLGPIKLNFVNRWILALVSMTFLLYVIFLYSYHPVGGRNSLQIINKRKNKMLN